jgi:two-component system, chemotaxis family, chemotaxis protein CheY
LASGVMYLPFTMGPPASPTPDARPCGHKAVLIVEDEDDLRQMMAQMLAIEGFKAATVSNGREALAYLELGDYPEVILLDLMMPVMDGWEFSRRQQSDPRLKDVPVIVLSALDAGRAADVRSAAFLKKPLDFDLMLRLVRGYCGHESG